MAEILAVIGGQYGSEGKGVIVAHLADRYSVHVRVGGPNAGHSFYHHDKVWKMRCIPCGWINPNAHLIIGAGAYISFDILRDELKAISEFDPDIASRVIIDEKAVLITERHKYMENDLRGAIGSTGEGVGAARLGRISRDPGRCTFVRDWSGMFQELGVKLGDTVDFLYALKRSNHSILLEGTQGTGLSLIHGEWPYVTSHDVSVAQMLADVGLSIKGVKTLMVIRTYPIRVGGNSGKLNGEIDWSVLSRRLGKKVEERTTVTNKVRRVGLFDFELVRQAIKRNEPDALAITFLDYVNPADTGVDDYWKLSVDSKSFIANIEQTFSIPVHFVTTGWRDGYGWQVVEC